MFALPHSLCVSLFRNRPNWFSCSYSKQDFSFKAKLGIQKRVPACTPSFWMRCLYLSSAFRINGTLCQCVDKQWNATLKFPASENNKDTSVISVCQSLIWLCVRTLMAIFVKNTQECKWWRYLHECQTPQACVHCFGTCKCTGDINWVEILCSQGPGRLKIIICMNRGTHWSIQIFVLVFWYLLLAYIGYAAYEKCWAGETKLTWETKGCHVWRHR